MPGANAKVHLAGQQAIEALAMQVALEACQQAGPHLRHCHLILMDFPTLYNKLHAADEVWKI